jgi:hypothetical protein
MPRMTELTRTLVYRPRLNGYTHVARVSARSSDRGSPMQTQHHTSPSDHLGREDNEVHAAVRFGVLAAVAGLAFLIVAALWDSTCKGAMSVDTVACGAPQLTILALGAPVILLVAGIWAFVRTYRVWRDHGVWWAWQGAGWFLMVLMFVTLTMGAPIAGPVLAR